jgi:hypothetical protein
MHVPKKGGFAMTREEAVKMADSKWYELKTAEEIVKFQLYEERLCMPFSLFHKAIEEVLGRPVYTHEFACVKNLQKEFENLITKN